MLLTPRFVVKCSTTEPSACVPAQSPMATLRRAIAVRIARNVSKNGAPERIRTADPQIRSLVLSNCINIMQDHITRARLAGEPPHVMLAPRLRDIGLREFNRAKEAIAEGRYCVEQALPMLRHYL